MPHSIKIAGIAPPELATLAEPLRRQFWQLVAPIALKVKDDELAAGLDAQGEPLKPIRPATRKDRRSAMTPSGKGDPDAPPLMPAYQKSRVRSLLAGRAFATHAELYWRYDPFTGASFDVILNYQRKKGRDVFGISKEGMRKIRAGALVAWQKWKKGGLAPTEKKSAFPSAALSAGPQARIAGIVARSAEPGAGATAPAGVGKLGTRWITRGIGAPTVKELKASTTRSGAMTGPEWRKYFTEEEGQAGGGKAAKPRAPKPKAPAVAKVAMKQRVKRYEVEYHGALTDAEKQEHESWVRGLPAKILADVKAAGYKFVHADRLITFDPELAAKQPRGWPVGSTWEQAEGFQDPVRKIVFTSKERKRYGSDQYVVSDRQKGVFYHETGHAVDAAGQAGYYSRKKDFVDAHAKDAQALTDEQKAEESYLLQRGDAGPSETFAEVFANLFGEGAGRGRSAQHFPECAKLILRWLGLSAKELP